jgi:hypothetical protein
LFSGTSTAEKRIDSSVPYHTSYAAAVSSPPPSPFRPDDTTDAMRSSPTLDVTADDDDPDYMPTPEKAKVSSLAFITLFFIAYLLEVINT